jgi:hypothetical protein
VLNIELCVVATLYIWDSNKEIIYFATHAVYDCSPYWQNFRHQSVPESVPDPYAGAQRNEIHNQSSSVLAVYIIALKMCIHILCMFNHKQLIEGGWNTASSFPKITLPVGSWGLGTSYGLSGSAKKPSHARIKFKIDWWNYMV